MRDETLLRLSGFAAIAGGLLRAANAFTGDVLSADTLQFLYFLTDVLLIFGLAGIYLQTRAQTGWLGFAGFTVAVFGLLMVRSGDLFGGYQTGASVALLGTVVLGATLLKQHNLRLASFFWIASLVAGLAGVVDSAWTSGGAVAGVAFGAGFMAAGLTLNRTSSAVV